MGGGNGEGFPLQLRAMQSPKLLADDALVLFADLQEGIVERSRTIERKKLGQAVAALAKLAKIFELPVLVTTVPGSDGGPAKLIPELEAEIGAVQPLQRFTTDSLENEAIRKAIEATRRRTLLIAGVATEIAVQRPSLHGVREGYAVQVVLDACGGISERSEAASLQRLVAAGVVLTSVAAVAGELAADLSQPRSQQGIGILMSL